MGGLISLRPYHARKMNALYADSITEQEAVAWDDTTDSVRASKQYRLGALVLSEQAISRPDPGGTRALLKGVGQAGLATLAWTPELQQWRARVQFLKRIDRDSTWPDLSDDTLLRTLDEWLGPFLSGVTTLERVQRLDLGPPRGRS